MVATYEHGAQGNDVSFISGKWLLFQQSCCKASIVWWSSKCLPYFTDEAAESCVWDFLEYPRLGRTSPFLSLVLVLSYSSH